jgi:predicted RNA methylase
MRIPEPTDLMIDKKQCQVYNQSLLNSYDLVEYVNLYKNYLGITSGKIVDLGSGSCNFVIALCLEFSDLTVDCYEASEEMIKLAEENIRQHNLADRIQIIKDNLLNATGNYGAVLINRVLHHIDDTEQLWKVVNDMSSNVFAIDLERPLEFSSLDRLFEVMESMFDDIYVLDTRQSFMAAYTADEVREQIKNYGYNVLSMVTNLEPDIKYSKLIIYHTK